jgi:regulator of replication initiation timing
MDIVEKLRLQADRHNPYLSDLLIAAEKIERLRDMVKNLKERMKENHQLQAENKRMLELLDDVFANPEYLTDHYYRLYGKELEDRYEAIREGE